MATAPPDFNKIAEDQHLLIDHAGDRDTTPFDYIVVGSGAGGGPLAARLALAGKRVLVLEAGTDPAVPDSLRESPLVPQAFVPEALREVHQVPGYHAAATEDPQISWEFSVRHYDDDARQALDTKYEKARDPSASGGTGKGGIQYPRASALGGCTAHHAMIVVKPNDADWDLIADRTGDDSWRADNMQGYFARIERCLYYTSYNGFLRRTLGVLYEGARRLAAFINPRYQLDWGGHGYTGWQPTSFIDPILIALIAKRDGTFLRVLFHAIWFLLRLSGAKPLLKSLLRLQIIQYLDPNFRDARRGADGQLAFIPIGTDGQRRSGVRELLLSTAAAHPDRLVLLTGVLATRVVFEKTDSGVPRAVGVEVAVGTNLYEPSPRWARPDANEVPRAVLFAKEEIVLAGGAFNSPQILMLSGIGDAPHLKQMKVPGPRDKDGAEVADVVHLPGVGRNLQDRYEVSVISEASKPFSTLNGVSFVPGDANDPARKQWHESGRGLYATNGGALAIFVRSSENRTSGDPDLFIFGVPAAFRGYYWTWSRELLRKLKGAPHDQRNLWTWIILKAYTSNTRGTVSLRSDSPFHQPDIIFRSFSEGPAGFEGDVTALADGVRFVRSMNARIKPFETEIQPGPGRGDHSPALREWIENEAWGHHACGTCRMGSDAWQADVKALNDQGAVLDSQFRVHGVSRLRVVDASVFPTIPGYFIVTSVFMASEKAADALLARSKHYPEPLKAAEAKAIRERRAAARQPPVPGVPPLDEELPPQAVGLALSGGGIRCATFALGVLQALAVRNKLRNIDFMSSVSGGGYVASFLGRLYTRLAGSVADTAGRVQDILARSSSSEIWWLRTHANYLSSEGRSDFQSNLGAVWRNLLAVHLCIGSLFLAVFAALRWLTDRSSLLASPGAVAVPGLGASITLSPWWWLPVVVFLVGVVPIWFGFWLGPKPGSAAPHSFVPLAVWLVLLGGGIAALSVPGIGGIAALFLGALVLAWLAQEIAQWYAPPRTGDKTRGVVVRNRLTRTLGKVLLVLVGTVLWVVLDSLALTATTHRMAPPTVSLMVVIATALPLLKDLVVKVTSKGKAPKEAAPKAPGGGIIVPMMAMALAAFQLYGLDVLAHASFKAGAATGTWVLLVAVAVSLAVGRAFGFVNLSSLESVLAARLVRTYLGASNPVRTGPQSAGNPTDVDVADPGDDMAFDQYHPEQKGGPLHLINVCVNETVDAASGRHLREDKGLSMCVSSLAVSVGRRFHALWTQGPSDALVGVRALRESADPRAFHVLARSDQETTEVEALRLGHWTAISAAAFTTGSGRHTRLPLALLLGLFNARLGYWWDTRIDPGDRPGRFPPSLLRRLKALPGQIFHAQAAILNEWRAYFGGPSARRWYLSDGAHFEGSGMYELLRRRLPFIIALDSAHDPAHLHDGTALVMRRARLDFGAEFTWIDPTPQRRAGVNGWPAVDQATPGLPLPGWIKAWINPDALGPVWEIGRSDTHAAALARIVYAGVTSESWVLLLKTSVIQGLPLDLQRYAAANPSFPNQSSYDQSYDDDQWESYRLLGEVLGRSVFA